MSEKSPQSANNPTLLSVYDQLLNYANNDADFRAGKTLATESIWRQKTAPDLLIQGDDAEESDDDSNDFSEDTTTPLYNEKTISFEASRRHQKKVNLSPSLLAIKHSLRSQRYLRRSRNSCQ